MRPQAPDDTQYNYSYGDGKLHNCNNLKSLPQPIQHNIQCRLVPHHQPTSPLYPLGFPDALEKSHIALDRLNKIYLPALSWATSLATPTTLSKVYVVVQAP